MKRALTAPAMHSCLVCALVLCTACAETTSDAESISVTIESKENIVSENGMLELTRGTLAIRSVALVGGGDPVPLVRAVTVDLSLPTQALPLVARIPPGAYTGLRVELAPPAEGATMMDVDLRSTSTGEAVRAISDLSMQGNSDFPEGPRVVTESSGVELHILLRGMFFYLAPVTDSIDGVYEAGEAHRDFLTMDLIGMFDFHVLP